MTRMTSDDPHLKWRATTAPSLGTTGTATDRTDGAPPSGAGGEALRVLIVADHASLRFGGEAALPYHYFRVLRRRGVEAWMVAHARCREELEAAFPEDRDRFAFVSDTWLHRPLWFCVGRSPAKIGYLTFGMAMRLLTQFQQRQRVRQLVSQQQIHIVHQPMPVSPKEPSLLHNVGAPVVIGPMNGGMTFPHAFAPQFQGWWTRTLLALGRFLSDPVHRFIPGKRRAELLLVANARTAAALPGCMRGRVVELVENGVDLERWRPEAAEAHDTMAAPSERPVRFTWVGRMVDWKAVDLLLEAFARVAPEVSCELELIGDGPERAALEARADALGLKRGSQLSFAGWQPQEVCARHLACADVMVLPSLLECGGAVVLEAMAMSRPVIATAWGGPVDYLDPECGILVEPTSREALIDGLAEAMLALARAPERRAAMGAAGRRRVVELFDWERKVDRVLELYQQVLEPEHAGAGPRGRG
ncbi:MAG: glycosyltransferase family 4 protein [Phycisphaeraceae bacterium]